MKTYWIESGGEPVYILAVIGYFVCLYTLGRLALWAVLASLVRLGALGRQPEGKKEAAEGKAV